MPRPKGYSPLFGRVLTPSERKAFEAGTLQPPQGLMRRKGRVLKSGDKMDTKGVSRVLNKIERRLDPMIEKKIEAALEKLFSRVRFNSALSMSIAKKRGRRPGKSASQA